MYIGLFQEEKTFALSLLTANVYIFFFFPANASYTINLPYGPTKLC